MEWFIAEVTRSPICFQKTLWKAGDIPVRPGALSLDMVFINAATSSVVKGSSSLLFSASVIF